MRGWLLSPVVVLVLAGCGSKMTAVETATYMDARSGPMFTNHRCVDGTDGWDYNCSWTVHNGGFVGTSEMSVNVDEDSIVSSTSGP